MCARMEANAQIYRVATFALVFQTLQEKTVKKTSEKETTENGSIGAHIANVRSHMAQDMK